MKSFTRKFFLLTIGMILSVGAYAQDEITHHWPEVRFTLCNSSGNYVDMDGKATQDAVWCTVPAWDAWLKGSNTNGHIRVQKYEETGENTFNARLVTRYAVTDDNRLKVPALKATSLYAKINDTGDPVNMVGLQYKDVFGTETGPDGTNYNIAIIETSYSSKITGEYKIPVHMTHQSGETYDIDEIGAYAFRQPSRGEGGESNYVQATKIIIPKEIKSIGRGAFFMNAHTKVVEFEEGSPVKDILEFNFQDNSALEEISFPSSLETLTGTVLGGCHSLKRVAFASVNPPALEAFTWNDVERDVFESTTSASATVPEQCIIEVPLHAAKNYVDSNDKFKEFPMSSKFPMAYDMITYCSDLEFTFKQYDTSSKTWSDGSLKAYYAEVDGLSSGKVTMTEITESKKIPSTNFGVLLKGTQNETYDIFYPNNLIDGNISYGENCLIGVVGPTTIDPAEKSDWAYYVLSTDGKFHRVKTAGTLGANKAYLLDEEGGPGSIPSSTMSVTLPGDETGIEILLVEDEADDAVYTLQGTKVSQSHKGLVIQNGKKYIVR